MIFQTTIDRKKARQIAYKRNADHIIYYIISMIFIVPLCVGAIFSYGIIDKIFSIVVIVFMLMVGFIIIYGSYLTKCRVFSAYKIKEYILTVEFAENEIIISTNLNEKTTSINYDRIRKCIISQDYLIFVTAGDTSFEIEKAAVAEIGLEQFKEFVKDKMPQIEKYMSFIEA